MCNTVPSACFSQCRYFAVAWNKCYMQRLWTTFKCVDGQACSNFHGMVQCYGQMLPIAVTLRSNFLNLATSLQTALVTHWCHISDVSSIRKLLHSGEWMKYFRLWKWSTSFRNYSGVLLHLVHLHYFDFYFSTSFLCHLQLLTSHLISFTSV